MKKELTNIIELCKALGNPQEEFRSIHVAGTNGKGSLTHILAAVLQKQGYKVGCYTSPHYKDFRERIKINAEFVSEDFVIKFVEKNKELMLKIRPSFFEITVAMAFKYFAQQKIDIAIVETGLGGRLDSTNIITPILSIITNISKDHTQFLGNTIEEIAFEKAGIIKKDIPIIIGKKQKKTIGVFSKKAEIENNSLLYSKNIVIIKKFSSNFGKRTAFILRYKNKVYKLKTDLTGVFQKENMQTALASLFFLKENKMLKLKKKNIFEGIKNIQKDTFFIGRNMLLNKKPVIIADSAHNVAGIKELVKQINKTTYNNLHFVYGTVSDKDIDAIFSLLPKKAGYYFCKPNIIRGMETNILQEKAMNFGLENNCFKSVVLAFDKAKDNASENDLIIVGGSIFVVGEVL